MLYIHELNQLTERTADVESVAIIREIKQRTPYPIDEKKLREQLLNFFVSPTDIEQMEQSLALLPATRSIIDELVQSRDTCLEPFNVQRAVNMLNEVPTPLERNIAFAKMIAASQEAWVSELAAIFNDLPKLRTNAEKVAYNNRFNTVLKALLRSEQFRFNGSDIVWEAPRARVTDLIEALDKGFLFHFSIEDQLKKVSYEALRRRLPAQRVEQSDKVKANLLEIRKGVERSYQINMRMLEWSVVLYSYIKWLMSVKA